MPTALSFAPASSASRTARQQAIHDVDRLWRSGTSTTVLSPSSRDDAALLARFLATGDRRSIIPLLRRHRVATWRLAAVVTLDVDAAADAVEATWVEVLGLGGVGRPTTWSNPRSWLFEITHRHAHASRVPGSPNPSDQRGAEVVPFDRSGPRGQVAAAFTSFDEAARTAIWLHLVEGLDEFDIASVLDRQRLGTSPLVHAAMGAMRDSIGDLQTVTAPATCAPILGDMVRYLDDELDATETGAFVDHITSCRRCAARLDAIETPGLTLVDRVLPPPEDLTARLRRALFRLPVGPDGVAG